MSSAWVYAANARAIRLYKVPRFTPAT